MRSHALAGIVGMLAGVAPVAHAVDQEALHAEALTLTTWADVRSEAPSFAEIATDPLSTPDERETFAHNAQSDFPNGPLLVEEAPPTNSYAMILAGLGAWGFMRRRRSHR